MVIHQRGRVAYVHRNPGSWTPQASGWARTGLVGVPDIPVGFAAVVLEMDRIRLIVGDRHEVPLAYHRTERRVTVGTCLRHLMNLLPEPPALDPGDLVTSILQADRTRTHFRGIHRVPFGTTLVLSSSGSTSTSEDQAGTEAAALPGSQEANAMQAAISDAVARTRDSPVAVAMSGGLDSTVLAALAAREGETTAVSHVPRHRSGWERPRWVEDERSAITATAQYINGLQLCLVPSPEETMLDHLPDAFAQTCAPVLNPSALPWLRSLADTAAEVGAQSLMVGQAGNATFSRQASQRPWQRIRGQARLGLTRLRRTGSRHWHPLVGVGLRSQWLPERVGRASGHRELIRDYARSGGLQPFSRLAYTNGLPISDPFSDARVVSTALRVSEAAWARGGLSRSLARRTAAGLVPDEVRLRTEKGAQGVDQWVFRMAAQPRFLEAVDRVAASTGAREILDVHRLRRSILDWPQYTVGQHIQWDGTGGRVLGLGLFIAWWEDQRRSMHRSGASDSVLRVSPVT